MDQIKKQDKEIASLIEKEEARQGETLDLIPSENYPSKAVREALGSVFVAKYSEGRPYRRYYAGMKHVDALEVLVEQRVRRAFHLTESWAVNVQPYSGSPANYAVLRALLKPGDTILSLDLGHGGHLTHGSPVSLSGMDFRIVHYLVDKKTHLLDYKQIETLAKKEKPKLIIAGYSAYPQEVDFAKFGRIARSVKAYLLADISHISGLVLTGLHPSPFPHAHVVMTTTHKLLRGPRGAMIICREELRDQIFKTVFPGLQGGPHNHTIAAIGVALKEAMTPGFRKYALQVKKNAAVLAAELKKLGFDLVTGGTANHLLLVDLTNKGIAGKEAQERLEAAGIVCNRNVIPYDQRKPFNPSGIRLGTPALTSRGMKEREMRTVASFISRVLEDETAVSQVKKEVKELALHFQLP